MLVAPQPADATERVAWASTLRLPRQRDRPVLIALTALRKTLFYARSSLVHRPPPVCTVLFTLTTRAATT